jgi:flagellar assembly protein FliH
MLCEDSKRLRGAEVQSFRYAPIGSAAFRGTEALPFGSAQNIKGRDAAFEEKLVAAVAAARTKGFQEAQAGAKAAAAEIIERERAAVTAAVQEFSTQRTEYFRKVEVEAVRLALSIARKVLHREAQMDPLLLAGVVRVALDQMQAGTRVVLHTSPDSARNWAEFCSGHFEQSHAIEVVPDAKLTGHNCVLEADIGSSEIGVESQLQEIESGFFDRLGEAVASSTP